MYAWIQRRIPARSRSAVLRSEVIGLLVLVVISQIWKALVLAGGNPHQIVVTPMLDALPSFFDQFAVGMGLALLSVWIELEGTTPRVVRVFDRYPGLAWLFAALAFWAVATQIGLGRFFAPVERSASTSRATGCTPRSPSGCCCPRSSAISGGACPGGS